MPKFTVTIKYVNDESVVLHGFNVNQVMNILVTHEESILSVEIKRQ